VTDHVFLRTSGVSYSTKVDAEPPSERSEAMIEWGTPDWGKPGHNVHAAENGSWWGDEDDRNE